MNETDVDKYQVQVKIFIQISFVIIIIFNSLVEPNGAFADTRLEKLVHEFAGWKKHSMKFDDPRSPLFPYRHRRFEDGLSEGALADAYRLQEAGECHGRLQDYAVEGFFELYPFLLPALYRDPLGRELTSSIRWRDSDMWDRCYYFLWLNELNSWFDIRRLEPLDGRLPSGQGGHENLDPDKVMALEEWRSISSRLGTLAFCSSYPPSIRDVMKVAHDMGGLTFTAEEGVYLASRARLHGIISQIEVEAVFKDFQGTGMMTQDINRLFSLAQTLRLHEMPSVEGNWQARCAFWFRFRKTL